MAVAIKRLFCRSQTSPWRPTFPRTRNPAETPCPALFFGETHPKIPFDNYYTHDIFVVKEFINRGTCGICQNRKTQGVDMKRMILFSAIAILAASLAAQASRRLVLGEFFSTTT
jgi:hypothetical protein